MNPLLAPFKTPFETVPFDLLKDEHFLPALKERIKDAHKEIQKIKESDANFTSTIEALENLSWDVDCLNQIFFNLHDAEGNENFRAVAKEISAITSDYANDLLLDKELFLKVKEVYNEKENLSLNEEEKMLLKKSYKSFTRNGALLDEKDKERLREIDKELSRLALDFSDHILSDTNNFLKTGDDLSVLEGLPPHEIESAKLLSREKKTCSLWALNLTIPTYISVMTYAKRRDLREEFYRAYGTRGFLKNENDNQEIILKMISLRKQRAQLLGYKNHAEYILEERMASNPQTVLSFLNDFILKAKNKAIEEFDELKKHAENDGVLDFSPWDLMYYYEKIKKQKFEINDEDLRPYFKLENVLNGVFTVAEKLYGLKFKENKNLPTYHKDVASYEVLTSKGEHKGIFYADFFPRDNKRAGAWMTSFREQRKYQGKDVRPHVSIVCNFTKPTESTPSLLTFTEVKTLFHEFGHALHGLLSKGTYKSLSGTNVYWDFVELPSQFMENFCYEKECLDLFAHHYETGELIPKEYIQKIKESSNFHEARMTLRQVSLGLLDMAWHTINEIPKMSVSEFEKNAVKETQILPYDEKNNVSTSFSHIFSGGYSSGYYSYKWAEVLEADAFELFKEKGIFNYEIAKSFEENVLSKGGSLHPLELFTRFRGRKPQIDPLLRRSGLIR